MKRLFVALAIVSLGGCAGRRQVVETIVPVKVAVPVASPCVPESFDSKGPDYPDTDEALKRAADAAERYLLMAAGRGKRIARNKELETVVAGCPKATK